MKTVTCDFCGIHPNDYKDMTLIIFSDRFPERNGHRCIAVSARDVSIGLNSIRVHVGRGINGRSFLLKVCKPRRSKPSLGLPALTEAQKNIVLTGRAMP